MARLPSVLARIVGLVLRISPRDFRARFGPEIVDGMERGLQEAVQRRGAIAMLGLWGRGMGDALKTAAHERQIEGRAWFGGGSPWSDLVGDVKYALRGWRRSPGFSLTVVSTLALGLGLASAHSPTVISSGRCRFLRVSARSWCWIPMRRSPAH